MILQGNFLSKASPAHVTRMPGQQRVLILLVELQRAFPIERLPALVALERLLVRVAHHVIKQFILGHERFGTLGTDVILDDRVLPTFVHDQVAREAEVVPAEVAHERFTLRVGQHVLFEAALLGGRVTADCTGERLLLAVVQFVISERGCLTVGFAANVALVPIRVVAGHVAKVGHLCLEALAAQVAQEVD